jgi:ribosomal protein S18 acetylase RimI-like enzyme
MDVREYGLDVRRLTAADAGELGRFFEEVAADGEASGFFHPHPMTRPFAAELCGRLGSLRDRYYGMWLGDRVVGYMMLRGWDEGYAAPSFGACTHPQLRDAGLGQLLLAHAIAETRAAGAGLLRLTVYADNARAVHVYRKFGFVFGPPRDGKLVGVLDLADAPAVFCRPPDRDKLLAWARQAA